MNEYNKAPIGSTKLTYYYLFMLGFYLIIEIIPATILLVSFLLWLPRHEEAYPDTIEESDGLLGDQEDDGILGGDYAVRGVSGSSTPDEPVKPHLHSSIT